MVYIWKGEPYKSDRANVAVGKPHPGPREGGRPVTAEDDIMPELKFLVDKATNAPEGLSQDQLEKVIDYMTYCWLDPKRPESSQKATRENYAKAIENLTKILAKKKEPKKVKKKNEKT